MFLAVAVAALLVSLVKVGAFFVVAGTISVILLLVGVAIAISHLRPFVAGMACGVSVVVVLCAGLAVSQQRFAFRSAMTRLLGESFGTKENVDILIFYLWALGIGIILGSLLGWGLAKSQE